MLLNKENIEDIQIVLTGTENGVSLREKEKTIDDEGWYISNDSLFENGKINENGDYDIFNDISLDTLINKIHEKDLVVFYEPSGYNKETLIFKEWTHLAKYLGITNMVTLGTKIPAIIARRFKYFASQKDIDVSSQLRQLIIDFVKEEWKNNNDNLIYKENI